MLRNSKQAEGDDQLFADSAAGSKAKKTKGVVDEDDEDAYVAVDLNGKTLHIKKVARTIRTYKSHWNVSSSRSCLIFEISLVQVL